MAVSNWSRLTARWQHQIVVQQHSRSHQFRTDVIKAMLNDFLGKIFGWIPPRNAQVEQIDNRLPVLPGIEPQNAVPSVSESQAKPFVTSSVVDSIIANRSLTDGCFSSSGGMSPRLSKSKTSCHISRSRSPKRSRSIHRIADPPSAYPPHDNRCSTVARTQREAKHLGGVPGLRGENQINRLIAEGCCSQLYQRKSVSSVVKFSSSRSSVSMGETCHSRPNRSISKPNHCRDESQRLLRGMRFPFSSGHTRCPW